MDESDVKRLIKAASDLRLSEMAKREKDAAKKEQEGLEKQKEKTLDARIGFVTHIGYFVTTLFTIALLLIVALFYNLAGLNGMLNDLDGRLTVIETERRLEKSPSTN